MSMMKRQGYFLMDDGSKSNIYQKVGKKKRDGSKTRSKKVVKKTHVNENEGMRIYEPNDILPIKKMVTKKDNQMKDTSTMTEPWEHMNQDGAATITS